MSFDRTGQRGPLRADSRIMRAVGYHGSQKCQRRFSQEVIKTIDKSRSRNFRDVVSNARCEVERV